MENSSGYWRDSIKFDSLNEANMPGNLRAFTAELVGTFALIFLGAGAVCLEAVTGKLGLTGIALAHGLTIAAMAAALGHVSGGHFNPAVTAAMFATRRIDAVRAVGFVLAQLLGAALAALLLLRLFHNFDVAANPPFLGACDLSGVGFKGGAALEAVITFLLVTVIFGTAVDEHGKTPLAPLVIGLTITADIFAAGPLTGAAINPARAFGPALATGHWANHGVYWIGPLAGGVAAALLYQNLFLKRKG